MIVNTNCLFGINQKFIELLKIIDKRYRMVNDYGIEVTAYSEDSVYINPPIEINNEYIADFVDKLRKDTNLNITETINGLKLELTE